MISPTDRSVITDGSGDEVAKFHKKLISIHQIHTIEMAGGEVLTMKVELMHPLNNIIDVEENGWKLKGKFTSHTYQVVDRDEAVLAEITRPWLAIHDKCQIDVKDETYVDEIIALTMVLEHMLIDTRQTAEATAGGSYRRENRS